VIAAPGILALTEMTARLAEDHENARILAAGIAGLPGVVLEPARVETNIVVFRLPGVGAAEAFAEELSSHGVLVSDFGAGRLRMVTHYGISAADCRKAVAVMTKVWAANRQ
jgi:threonine aldolase